MAGEGDARSSAEMAVKHVSWSKVCGVAALANTGLAGLASVGCRTKIALAMIVDQAYNSK